MKNPSESSAIYGREDRGHPFESLAHPKLVVIADDLTGALDSSVAFAERGYQVAVSVDAEALRPALVSSPEVLAINTHSRGLDEGAAIDRVAAVARFVATLQPPIIFKKVDSRLQGHPVTEIRELLMQLGERHLILAPGVPRLGRTVEGGALRGRGIASAQILRDCFGSLGNNISIPDTVSERDFDALAAHALEHADTTLCVGASSFASAIARQLPLKRDDDRLRALRGPLLIAIGSRDPITSAQVDYLRRMRPDVRYIAAPDGVLANDIAPDSTKVTVIQCRSGALDSLQEHMVATRFATALAPWVSSGSYSTLLASGGDTAFALLSELGVQLLRPLTEFRPGLPVSEVVTASGKLTHLITKSGGFGDIDVLVRLIDEAVG